MREKAIEAKLVKAVRIMGGLAPKFISLGCMECQTAWCSLPKGENRFR